MSHPDYPPRGLDRTWRNSYRRRGRRLLVLGVLVVAFWAAVAWLVVRLWF